MLKNICVWGGKNKEYRYTLWREWDSSRGIVMFIGLNPSTADEIKNDRTITRCISYAQQWGFGSLCMTNLFAYRSTDPKKLKLVQDPVGPENDKYIKRIAKQSALVVAAWGNHGKFNSRDLEVTKLFGGKLHAISINKNGSPAHPLYLNGDLDPISFG